MKAGAMRHTSSGVGLWRFFGGLILAGLFLSAWAGNQAEERLADSVRTALSSAISGSPPRPPIFDSIHERIDYLNWLGTMGDKLKRRMPAFTLRKEFLETVWYESKRAGLDPALVLGLIQVESAFKPAATSHVGAQGFMQVMPFWAALIGDGQPGKLYQMRTNLRFGCVILRHYIDLERGDLYMALGRYNGSRGRSEYPNAVFSARRQWEWRAR
jgi:soluble lytic murein transglycosylase-like protein